MCLKPCAGPNTQNLGGPFVKIHLFFCAAVLAAPAAAQSGPDYADPSAAAPLQLVARQAAPQPAFKLPANSEVLLRTNQELTTKGKTWKEGDTFALSVVHDVMLGNYVVIPRGARAVGKITWLTSKGAFGKSGKMDVEMQYVEVGGQRIPLEGTYRQEGEGNTVATVGGVIAAGVFAGFITGKSGVIPQGRELMARTRDDIPVALPEGASLEPQGVIQAVEAGSSPASNPSSSPEVSPAIDPASPVQCLTCRP